jgi:Fe2+ transport system protein FeoA
MALKQMEYAELTDSTSSATALAPSLLAGTATPISAIASFSGAVTGGPISKGLTPEACTSFLEIGLHQLAVGARARITSVSSCNHPICHKLLSMGIVEGQIVTLKGIAPLGDPIQIEALGYKLSLRKCEAAHVKVLPLASYSD